MPHPGWNFPKSMPTRESITAMAHIFREISSDTCAGRHQPSFRPIAFPTIFQSSRYWYFHWLQ
jgi:hypothetical protein